MMIQQISWFEINEGVQNIIIWVCHINCREIYRPQFRKLMRFCCLWVANWLRLCRWIVKIRIRLRELCRFIIRLVNPDCDCHNDWLVVLTHTKTITMPIDPQKHKIKTSAYFCGNLVSCRSPNAQNLDYYKYVKVYLDIDDLSTSISAT